MSKKLMRLGMRRLHRFAKRHVGRMRRAAQVWQAARAAAAENGLSAIRIFQDAIVLRAVHSFEPEAYLRYRLFEPGRSREAKLRYIHMRIVAQAPYFR